MAGEIFYGNFNRIKYQTLPGASGSFSAGWTPTAAGTYTVSCRAWNGTAAECRPPSLVDASTYNCAGPGYEMTVTVGLPCAQNFSAVCGAGGTSVTLGWDAI